MMFERFTERARQVIVLAQEEARLLKHDYIGTEHILLGMLREEGLAAKALESRGITVENVRAAVVRIVGEGEQASPGQVPFTPRAKKALQTALDEALDLGHPYIGTEHLLLGLMHDTGSTASKILLDFDITAEAIRADVVRQVQRRRSARRSKPLGVEPHRYAVTIDLGAQVRRTMKRAAARGLAVDHDQVELGDLLYAFLTEGSAASLLADVGIDRDAIRAAIDHLDAGTPGGEQRPESPS